MADIEVSGAAKQRIYIDAIDEAFQQSTRDGKRKPRAKLAHRRLNDIAVRQMRLVEKQQRILGKALAPPLATRCETCGRRGEVDPEKVPGIVAASSDITNQIDRLARSIRDGQKAEREALAGLDSADLDLVLSSQLPRLGSSITEADRKVLVTLWFGEDVAGVLCK